MVPFNPVQVHPMSKQEQNQQMTEESAKAMVEAMATGYTEVQEQNPTTAAGTASMGGVMLQAVRELTKPGAGFSYLDLLPKFFALMDIVQRYGPALMDIVNEFKRLFGGGGTQAQQQPQQ